MDESDEEQEGTRIEALAEEVMKREESERRKDIEGSKVDDTQGTRTKIVAQEVIIDCSLFFLQLPNHFHIIHIRHMIHMLHILHMI
jgi:hypothetical protein